MAMLQDLPAGLNFTAGSSDSGLGGGMGMGFLLGALLGRGGLGLGGAGAEAVASCRDCVTNESLNQQTLGDIKASIPFAESQSQLAMAGNTAQLIANATANTMALQAGQNAAALAAATNAALVARDIAAVDTNVDRQSTAIQVALKDDGEKTRALIQSIDKANDSRLIVAQANEIIELKNSNARDRDRHGVEITMTNNQNQNQLNFQQQTQAFNQLATILAGLQQSIHATNQAINIGGTQLASPTNSNTNVKG